MKIVYSAIITASALLGVSLAVHLGCGSPAAESAAPADDAGIDAAPEATRDGARDVGDASDASDAANDAANACGLCASGVCSAGGCDPAVFLTSREYTGAIGDGGVAAADEECAALASAAGLPGTFRAWVASASGAAPAARFANKSSRPYRLVDGTRVAADFASLGSKNLEAAIGMTEKRTSISFAYVWTAADRNGSRRPGAGDCAGWTSSSVAQKGGSGESDDITEEWAKYEDITCATKARLYCFEQRP